MSPFEVDGQRGMPSAGINTLNRTDSSFVPVSYRALAVRKGARRLLRIVLALRQEAHETKLETFAVSTHTR
jgi:hypothetical protein